MQDLSGRVAVVTGGAGGIGRGIVEALLEEGARVVIGDVEEPVLEKTIGELSDRGEIRGVLTDVSDFDSVDALAQSVYDTEGACHLLFNNAGVTSGGGGKPWEQESNDWRWCYSVNVFGVAHGQIAGHDKSRFMGSKDRHDSDDTSTIESRRRHRMTWIKRRQREEGDTGFALHSEQRPCTNESWFRSTAARRPSEG